MDIRNAFVTITTVARRRRYRRCRLLTETCNLKRYILAEPDILRDRTVLKCIICMHKVQNKNYKFVSQNLCRLNINGRNNIALRRMLLQCAD